MIMNKGPYNGKSQQWKQEKVNNTPSETAESKFHSIGFKSQWIKEGADEELISFAEEAGKYMANNNLTKSKIRSIYGEIKRIQMGQFEKEKSSFYLLRPKVAYVLGREEKGKSNGLQLFKLIFDKAAMEVKTEKDFNNFCNMLEAILAYHRANGGKD